MNSCLHCGKTLIQPDLTTQGRSDRLFCDDRCKMRFHRAKKRQQPQPALLPGLDSASSTLSLTKVRSVYRPVFLEPIMFYQSRWGETGLTEHYYEVAAQDWQEYMYSLNHLCSLLSTIVDFLEIQGSVSKNNHEEDGDEDSGRDWCAYFSQLAPDLAQIETWLKQEGSPHSTFIEPHLPQIGQWIRVMTQAARFFVYENHKRKDEFEVAFEASFLTEMKRAQRQVVGWWFEYEALTRQEA